MKEEEHSARISSDTHPVMQAAEVSWGGGREARHVADAVLVAIFWSAVKHAAGLCLEVDERAERGTGTQERNVHTRS